MKKINFIPLVLSAFLFFFLLIGISMTQVCDSCGNACQISCGEKKEFQQTADTDFFYYELFDPDGTDVLIEMRPAPFQPPSQQNLVDYDLTSIWEEGTCESEFPNNCSRVLGLGSPEFCIKNKLDGELTGMKYYIRVKFKGYVYGDNYYNLTLTCGDWCGDGIVQDWEPYNEECDLGEANPHDPCQPYEECDYSCECHNFTSEMHHCHYYDFCEYGLNPDTGEPCCQDASGPAACCWDGSNPTPSCDKSLFPDAERNPSVTANRTMCWNEDYPDDITDICIDGDFRNHTRMTCLETCGNGSCDIGENSINCPEDCP